MNQSCELRSQSSCLEDTAKVVGKFRQQECGHGGWNRLKECVTTHLPNLLVLKMDGAETTLLNSTVIVQVFLNDAITCREATRA